LGETWTLRRLGDRTWWFRLHGSKGEGRPKQVAAKIRARYDCMKRVPREKRTSDIEKKWIRRKNCALGDGIGSRSQLYKQPGYNRGKLGGIFCRLQKRFSWEGR